MHSAENKLRAMHGRLANLRDAKVTVGVHKDAGEYEDGTKVSDVARWNHFGSIDGTLPSRPFLTIAVNNVEDGVRARMIRAAKISSQGGDALAEMKKAGEAIEKEAKLVIDSITTLTPNAPSTIKKKGKNHPLFDTGRLRDSISTKMEE